MLSPHVRAVGYVVLAVPDAGHDESRVRIAADRQQEGRRREVTQIPVIDLTKSVDPRDLLFWTKAWDKQAAEFAKDWGVPYTPVLPYDKVEDLPVANDECRLMTIERDIGAPGVAGFHDDDLGLIFARLLLDDALGAGSHEIVEEEGDSDCDGYTDMGNGQQVANESADPVEGDSYPVSVTIGNETRDVPVTNYVYRSWFDPNGKYPFDRLGKLDKPFSMIPGGGGYMIVRSADGSTNDVFARPRIVTLPGDTKAHASIGRKLVSPHSRLARRLYGKAA